VVIGLFVRYHVRPAVRRLLASITPVSVLSAAVLGAVAGYAYVQFFTAVMQGRLLASASLPLLRAVMLPFVAGFLIAGLRKRRGLVTFCSLTRLEPGNALRLLLLSNAGKPLRWAAIYVAAVLPVVVGLTPSLQRAVLHVAGDAVAVVLHYLAAALIAVLWRRGRRRGAYAGAYAAGGFVAVMGAEVLLFRVWHGADPLLLAVNAAAVAACWTVLTGRLDAAHVQRFLVSEIPSRARRSGLDRLLQALPMETKLYVKEYLLSRELVVGFLIAAALFGYLSVALVLGIPGERRAPTVIMCTYGAAVAAAMALGAFDARHLYFVKMTPVTFGRLTVSMLGSHCVGYLAPAAIVGALGMVGGMRAGVLPILLSQGVFVALAMWLISFRFLFVPQIVAAFFMLLVMGGGLILALASVSLDGVVWPAAYAGFVVVIPRVLYGGASRKYEEATIEDWAAA